VPAASRPVALIKGAGDLASGVALRLHRSGFAVVMTEVESPTVVRRTVAFAEAVYEGSIIVEGVAGVRARGPRDVEAILANGRIPVVIDPAATIRHDIRPAVLVDAIVAKKNLGTRIDDARVVLGLGPGFTAGVDVHAVIETMRGHSLGRALYTGSAIPNTGVPGDIGGSGAERVLRAPCPGLFRSEREIGDRVKIGETVGHVEDLPVRSNLEGILRGLLRSGLRVTEGFKLGDVDARAIPEHCFTVSDKAMAIAGGVLEAACALMGGVRFHQGVN
jgi:xanthine dehydrogenase accessory factor